MKRLISFILLFISPGIFAAQDIPDYYRQVSHEYEIPAALLYAIAQQESMPPSSIMIGRSKPWPWTLNCNGRAYYLQSRDKAVTIAKKYIKRGSSCDIGLMQISWRYHKQQFNSIDEALEPLSNLKVGAKYLRSLYVKSQSWNYAVGTYHSHNPVKARHYVTGVSKHLSRILGARF